MTHSLRLRLPLFISSLIAVSLGAFLTVSFHQVRAELLRAGQARAQAAADQLGALLAQSAQQQVTEAQRAAQDPAVRTYLERPVDADAGTRARQRLTASAAAGQPPLELWTADGERRIQGGLARVDRPPPATPALARPSA